MDLSESDEGASKRSQQGNQTMDLTIRITAVNVMINQRIIHYCLIFVSPIFGIDRLMARFGFEFGREATGICLHFCVLDLELVSQFSDIMVVWLCLAFVLLYHYVL